MPTNKIDATKLLEQDHREVEALFKKFEDLTDRAKVSKKKIADQICNELTVHAQVEEEIFYPAVRGAGKEFEDLIDEATVEHSSAKDLIAQIQSMEADEELYDAKVKVLQEQIEHHVEEEEGEMFKKVRKTSLDLETLGGQMQARKEELKAAMGM
ncbi:MAG TPA: hemerythrin domain-containing protein [Telluria sp.]|nr:hemerythrin domain-containing protein [Telluria sp.]